MAIMTVPKPSHVQVQHAFNDFREFLFTTTAIRSIRAPSPRPVQPTPPPQMHGEVKRGTPPDDDEFGQLMGDEIVSPPPEDLLKAIA